MRCRQGSHAALDRNPIDVTLAGLQPDLLRGAIKILLASPSYDALVVIVGSSGLAMPDLMAGAIRDSLATGDKPVLAFVSPHAPEAASILNQRGVPTFHAPEGCTAALAAMLQSSRWQEHAAADTAIGTAVSCDDFGAGSLDEAQAKQLFGRFGVPVPREIIVSGPEDATTAARQLGDKVVLKILSGEITHKSDVGGVAVNLTPEQVGPRLTAMAAEVATKAGIRPTQFLVQEMVAGGVAEMILGFHRDPLGTAVLLGMGGVTAELFKDTTMRLLPAQGSLTRAEALEMIRELKILAAARWLPRPPEGRCRRPRDRDRRLLPDGGAAGEPPGRGRDQSGLRAARGQGCPCR